MLLRVPPALPTSGKKAKKNAALHAWLNRLREAVIAGQTQVPHNLQTIEGPNGVSFIGNLGAAPSTPEEEEENENDFCTCTCGMFQVKYHFLKGSAEPTMFDMINTEAYTIPLPWDHSIHKTYWKRSGVRLTLNLALPFYIALIETIIDPVNDGPPGFAGGPSGNFSINGAVVPIWSFGFEHGPQLLGWGDTGELAPGSGHYNGFNLGSTPALASRLNFDSSTVFEQPLAYPFEATNNYRADLSKIVGGMLHSNLVDGVAGFNLDDLRDQLIAPGTVMTVRGWISKL